MDVRTVEFRAVDDYKLTGTLYDAGSPDVLLIASAMGVKRRYYDAFARFIAERGLNVLTFDYRGIGDSRPRSLRGFEGSMLDWGRLDVAAAIDFLGTPLSLSYLGHSAGGQIAGLAPNIDRIDRFVFTSSQSGYWRLWPGASKFGLLALWLTMPLISRIVGYFPSKLLGLGSEELPRNVASQWAKFGRHRDYLFGYADAAPYARITAPLLGFSFRDDSYAPRAAVEALLAKYSGARVTHKHVEQRGLGHFDLFRKGRADGLWEEIAAWLLP
jgi:predicted alpha/beta hydrolase